MPSQEVLEAPASTPGRGGREEGGSPRRRRPRRRLWSPLLWPWSGTVAPTRAWALVAAALVLTLTVPTLRGGPGPGGGGHEEWERWIEARP